MDLSVRHHGSISSAGVFRRWQLDRYPESASATIDAVMADPERTLRPFQQKKGNVVLPD
jgi:hypothetical protein